MCIMMRIFMMPKLRITTGKIQQGGINVWFHNQTFRTDIFRISSDDPNIIYKIVSFVT